MKRFVFMAAFAFCISVSSQTTADVIFTDNFDNVVFGSVPVAQVGDWDTDWSDDYNGDSVPDATVATVNAAGFLECVRTETTSPQAWAGFTQPTTTGRELHLEMQLSMDMNANGFSPQFGLWADGYAVNINSNLRRYESVFLVAMSAGTQDVWYYGDANGDGTSTWQWTGLTYTPNTSEMFEVDYVTGASTFDLTVAGNTVTGLGVNLPADVQGVFFSTDNVGTGTYLVDNVNSVKGQVKDVVVFSDNFDNVTAGSVPTAQVGHWDTDWSDDYTGDGVADVTVATVNAAGSLECVRTETTSPTAWAKFAKPVATEEELHLEMQLSMDMNADGFSPQFGLWADGYDVDIYPSTRNDLSVFLVAMAAGTQDVWYYGDANGDGTSTWQWTGLTYTPNTSEMFEVDYVAGASTFDLTVAGNTVTGLGVNLPADVQGVFFSTDTVGTGTYFVDNLVAQIVAQTQDPIAGDANGDGKVDGSDVTILAGNWQVGVDGTVEATWAMGDFNGDKKVDGSDVTILAGNWQYGVTAAAASVPEPSVLVMLLAGGLFLFKIRWVRPKR